MFNLMRKKKKAGEKGQALILVLVILTLGSLFIPPLLNLIGTGAKTSMVYDTKTAELYAADAGIQDAVWQIKYDHISDDDVKFPDYSPYDYATSWPYSISSVNNMPVNVTIQNIWIPKNIIQPDKATASGIATGGKLIVTGTMIQTGLLADDGTTKISQYRINFSYYPEAGWTLPVNSIGVWLPRGFTYFTDDNHKSSLENAALYPDIDNQATPAVQPWAGNEAVLWSFGANPIYESFIPDQTILPLVLQVTFYFAPPQDAFAKKPDAVAWIKSAGGNVPYSWDASFVVTKITSTAGSTKVESYNTKSELQKLASAVNGDYWATGNTLMKDAIPDGGYIRDTWLNPADHSSSATVPLESAPLVGDGIPVDGDVAAAYLYWTSWFNEASKVAVAPLNPDTCSNFNNWNNGSAWAISSNNFRAQYNGAGAPSRDLSLKNFINLSLYPSATVTVSWDQWVNTSGTGNQTKVPTADADTSGTWNTAPCWDDVDETIPNDADYMTGKGESQTRVPTSDDSNTGAFTVAPLWSKVDETTPNDGDYITGVTNGGGRATFGFPVFSIPAGATINNVTVYYRMKSTSANAKGAACLKVGSTYWAGTEVATTTSWVTSSYSWTTNPAGGNWTVAQVNGLLDFGVTSTDYNPDVQFSMVYAEVNYNANGYKLFNFSSFSIPTGSTITNLTVYVRAGDVSSGTNNIRPSIKVNGTYYHTTATSNDPGNNFTTYSYPYTTNPKTGSAWTAEDINGTGTNPLQQFGVYSDDLSPDIQVSMVYAQVNYTSPITAADGLDYAISWNGGISWTTSIEAFRGNIGTTAVPYAYDIPSQYVTNQFMIKFTLVGFDGGGQYCDIDNIKVTVMTPDTQVFFNIDGTRVHFDVDSDGNLIPKNDDGTAEITADRVQVIRNITSGVSKGFSYACYKDVTALVRAFSDKAPDPAMNYPGAAVYTVGGVNGRLGNNSVSEDQLAHAGWSLVIIYEGPTTLGHQLYLYDNFTYADDFHDLVFDGDNTKFGSTISGFIVPERIMVPAPETEAAKLTVFVGEGDDWITGEFIAFNAPEIYWKNPATAQPQNIPNSYKLWDGKTSVVSPASNTIAQPNNVWNGLSLVTSADGIDIDTFHIPWSSGVLSPGDTSAHIDIYTAQDNWNMIYIIISFRSSVTTGGSLMYLIKTN